MPLNADTNDLKVILVLEVDHDVNPAGVKGMGELGNVGTAADVASALYHETGRRVGDLPIPAMIWSLKELSTRNLR